MQQHSRTCIDNGWTLQLMLKRLSEEQIIALTKPHADGSQTYNCLGEHLNSAEILQQNSKVHVPGLKFSCEICCRNFRDKTLLKRHMVRHTQLKPFACDFPGCSYSGKIPRSVSLHKQTVHSSILYTCLLCRKNFKNYNFYKMHVANHYTGTPGVFKCLHRSCEQLFRSGEDLQKHTKEAHAHEYTKQFECNDCGMGFSCTKKLGKHVIVHWDWRPFKCDTPGCSYSAKRLEYLKSHKKNVHSLKCFTCCHCGNSFKDRARFKQHLHKHETGSPGIFKCHIIRCNETFSFTSDFMTHLKRHTIIECGVPGCLFTCDVKQDLNKHRQTMHSIFVYTCQLCGKGLHCSKDLKLHLFRHETPEHGFIKCAMNNCTQTFTFRADLKKHMMDHKTQSIKQNSLKIKANEFECQLCGKIIKSKRSNFQAHVLNHETETPGVIKCLFNRCKQTFASAKDLKHHVANHWNVSSRPFACDFPQCNFASKIKGNLLKHKRSVHSTNLYTCDMCGRQLKHLRYVSQHLERFHKIHHIEESSKPIVQRPKTAEEYQEVVCKDETEEVVFD
jgi:KRAB domain-containing zinc finger protein